MDKTSTLNIKKEAENQMSNFTVNFQVPAIRNTKSHFHLDLNNKKKNMVLKLNYCNKRNARQLSFSLIFTITALQENNSHLLIHLLFVLQKDI